MKILIVTQYFWPESFIINGLVGELVRRGHVVEVLTGLPNYPSGSFDKGYGLFKGPWSQTYEGALIQRTFLIPRGKGFVRLAINYFSFVVGGCLKAIFLKKNFDVIFCYAPSPITSCLPAVFLRWITKKPLVFWVQDLWPESLVAIGKFNSKGVMAIIGQVVRFIYKRCDLILTPSKSFMPSILKWNVSNDKIDYLPNWAEPFVSLNSKPEWIQNLPKGFKIGFAGNIGKAQDIPSLIEAAFILKDYTDINWIVVGEGSEKKLLENEILKKGLSNSIFVVGRKPYEEMFPFFEACDALLVSLIDEPIFSLTIPSKIQAYMAAGRPIIASLNGEGANLINATQSGIACKAQDPIDLAKAVLKIKDMNDEQRKLMGHSAMQFYLANFEKQLVISNLETILYKTAGVRN